MPKTEAKLRVNEMAWNQMKQSQLQVSYEFLCVSCCAYLLVVILKMILQNTPMLLVLLGRW